MKKCCFTGHRHIASEHINGIDNLLLRSVDYAYKNGCRNFYAGGALGFDTAAAKAVLLFKMCYRQEKLYGEYLVLPAIGTEKIQSAWSSTGI